MYADAGNRMRNSGDWDKQDAEYKQKSPTSRKLSTMPSKSSKTFRKKRGKPAHRAQSASREPSQKASRNNSSAGVMLRRSIYFTYISRGICLPIVHILRSSRCASPPQAPNLLHVMAAMHQVKFPPLARRERPQDEMVQHFSAAPAFLRSARRCRSSQRSLAQSRPGLSPVARRAGASLAGIPGPEGK